MPANPVADVPYAATCCGRATGAAGGDLD